MDKDKKKVSAQQTNVLFKKLIIEWDISALRRFYC